MSSLLETATQKPFLKKLLTWYKKDGRHDMPWRKTKDPYAVFLSEFMLQQTTVAAVRPYYDRFLKKFPTLLSLAKGDLNDVLALWSGLGYYARARNLWSAAKEVVKKFKGKIPSDPKQLIELSGIGPYTAGAVAAFAFNRPAAVLDGNIIRLFMRLLAIEDDPKLKPVQLLLQKTALDIVTLGSKGKTTKTAKGGSRDINLALMDVGSSICLPQNPKCGECPVADFCLAKQYNRQNEIPLKGDAPERQTVRRMYAAIHLGGKWLIGQRTKEGLFGGLWEFPGLDTPVGVEPVPYIEQKLGEALGFQMRVRQALPAFEHQLSHRIFLVKPFLVEPLRKEEPLEAMTHDDLPYSKFQWVKLEKLQTLGISAITSRIVMELRKWPVLPT